MSQIKTLPLLFFLISLLFIPSYMWAEAPATNGDSLPVKAKADSRGDLESKSGEDKYRELVETLAARVQQLESVVASQHVRLTDMEKRLSVNTAGPAGLSIVAAAAEGSQGNGALSQQKPAAAPQAAPSQSKGAADAAVAGWSNHAFLRRPDGSNETQFTGYAQFDFRGYQAGNHPPATFLVRRARTTLEGRLERYFEFKLEGDFADTSSTLLRDFYLRVHRHDPLQVTFGQFRVPISQEEMRSDAVQDFVERSLVNNLIPGRSPGFMLSGLVGKGVFEYQLGAFNGKGLLALNNNSTPETATRLRFTPWKNTEYLWLRGLSFGGAGTVGRESRGNSVRGQTESRSFVFFAPDRVNGRITRANSELTWLVGPLAIRAEYDQTNQQRRGLGTRGENLPAVVGKGYSGQITYLLTGESKTEVGGVSPKRNLFNLKGEGGSGAWELKFRYANLQIENGTSKSNRAETFHFGINWYLNPFVRSLLDFGVERFKDPLRSPRPGETNFFIVMSRIQVGF